MELHNDDDPTVCVMFYILFVLICMSVWLSFYTTILCSYAAITVLTLIITVSIYCYSLITDHLLIVGFLVYLLTVHFIVQCYAFVC